MPYSSSPWVRDLARRDVWLRRLRTTGLATLLLFDAVYASGGFDGRQRAAQGLPVAMSDPSSGAGTLIGLLGMGLVVAVAWRQRWPVVLTLAGSAAALLFQLGPTAAVIGLTSVLICRPLVDAYRLAPLVVAATALAVWRDLKWTPRPVSFWGTVFAADGDPVGWFVVVVLTVVLVALFVGVGVWFEDASAAAERDRRRSRRARGRLVARRSSVASGRAGAPRPRDPRRAGAQPLDPVGACGSAPGYGGCLVRGGAGRR